MDPTGADRTAIHPDALALIASFPSKAILVRRPGSTTAARRVNLHVRPNFPPGKELTAGAQKAHEYGPADKKNGKS